ncbi:unnamed protein product, partial [Mesorhabditis belari]|uniref:Uncharacterized protein n=1 Tax=Mesorhabditis belari TaxID=2138241 RepID=A0AAF3EU43_9BILA
MDRRAPTSCQHIGRSRPQQGLPQHAAPGRSRKCERLLRTRRIKSRTIEFNFNFFYFGSPIPITSRRNGMGRCASWQFTAWRSTHCRNRQKSTMTAVGGVPAGISTMTVLKGTSTMAAVGEAPAGTSTMTAVGTAPATSTRTALNILPQVGAMGWADVQVGD